MKNKPTHDTFSELDRQAHRIDDIRPLSPAMRKQWEAAKRTGAKSRRDRRQNDSRK
jgi:hypothetical protein